MSWASIFGQQPDMNRAQRRAEDREWNRMMRRQRRAQQRAARLARSHTEKKED